MPRSKELKFKTLYKSQYLKRKLLHWKRRDRESRASHRSRKLCLFKRNPRYPCQHPEAQFRMCL